MHHLRAVSLFLQTGGPGGFDLAGLLNNPGFMSMVNLDTDHSQAVQSASWSVQDEMYQYIAWGAPVSLSRFVFISFLGFSVAVWKLCLYFIKVK